MAAALGLLELDSIAVGIRTGDAMVKRSPVDAVDAGTVHPGRYLVLVTGDVAVVEEALVAGREAGAEALLDEIFLPDVHPWVVPALGGVRRGANDHGGEALGVVETRTVAAVVGAADRGAKGAEVELRQIRIADDLGGKAYCLFEGSLHEVEEAVELAAGGLRRPELLVSRVVIPQIHDDMLATMEPALRFAPHLRPARGRRTP